MPKAQEELECLKSEYLSLISRLKELNEDELKVVTGGSPSPVPHVVIECTIWKTCPNADPNQCELHIGTKPGAPFICPKLYWK